MFGGELVGELLFTGVLLYVGYRVVKKFFIQKTPN